MASINASMVRIGQGNKYCQTIKGSSNSAPLTNIWTWNTEKIKMENYSTKAISDGRTFTVALANTFSLH